jgi:hypothetical protein
MEFLAAAARLIAPKIFDANIESNRVLRDKICHFSDAAIGLSRRFGLAFRIENRVPTVALLL